MSVLTKTKEHPDEDREVVALRAQKVEVVPALAAARDRLAQLRWVINDRAVPYLDRDEAQQAEPEAARAVTVLERRDAILTGRIAEAVERARAPHIAPLNGAFESALEELEGALEAAADAQQRVLDVWNRARSILGDDRARRLQSAFFPPILPDSDDGRMTSELTIWRDSVRKLRRDSWLQ